MNEFICLLLCLEIKKNLSTFFVLMLKYVLRKKIIYTKEQLKKNIASVEITTLIIIKFEDNLQIVIIFEV